MRNVHSQISWPVVYTPPKGSAENFHAWMAGTIGILLEKMHVSFTFYGVTGREINITDFVGQDVAICFPAPTMAWPKQYPASIVLHSIDEFVSLLAKWLTEAGIIAQPDREDPDCLTLFDADSHYFLLDFMVL